MFVYISCIVGTSACFTYSYPWNVDVYFVIKVTCKSFSKNISDSLNCALSATF